MAMTTAQKLRVKAGDVIKLVATPGDYESRLGELPSGVQFVHETPGTPVAVHWLVRTVDELADRFPELMPELNAADRVWIVYPRKKKYNAGDANRDSVWKYLETQGWRAVANYPVDAEYSAVWAKPA